MKILRIALLVGAAVLLVVPGIQPIAQADSGAMSFKTELIGYEEVPAVSSTGSGEFKAKVSQDENSFDYQLSYEDLEGTVTQSHIHFGQMGVNGGISIWLCQTATNPSPVPTTPTCPGPNSGMVTGTVSAADVIGPAGQGIAAGEFAEILNAIRQGISYANVHSSRNPGGEIRGQIQQGG